MSRIFQLTIEEQIQDHYFRLELGLAQNESVNIILNQDSYISQLVIKCATSSTCTFSVRLPSGKTFDLENLSPGTNIYLNDANDEILWTQLPKGSSLLVEKTDAGSSGTFEIAVTTRAAMNKPPSLSGRLEGFHNNASNRTVFYS
jgi:hypothetical protein